MKITLTHEDYSAEVEIPEDYQRVSLPLFDKWLAALKSGKYTQERLYLRSANGGYCCLGVYCEVANIPSKQIHPSDPYVFGSGTTLNTSALPVTHPAYQSLHHFGQLPHSLTLKLRETVLREGSSNLSQLNDSCCPFPLIAKILELFFKP